MRKRKALRLFAMAILALIIIGGSLVTAFYLNLSYNFHSYNRGQSDGYNQGRALGEEAQTSFSIPSSCRDFSCRCARGDHDLAWEKARKEQLLQFYPLSSEAIKILLNQISICHAPGELGWARGYLFWEEGRAELSLSSPNLSAAFHEFTHMALYLMVDLELYPIIVADIQREVVNPTPGYEDVARYLSAFSPTIAPLDPHGQHYIMYLAEVTGGNLNLIPPKLRKYYLWLDYTEPRSWEEVRELYADSNEEARRLIRVLYGNQTPYFGADPPPGENGPESLPEWVWRRLEVWAEAERDLLLDFLLYADEYVHLVNDDPYFWGYYKEGLIFAADLHPDLREDVLTALKRVEHSASQDERLSAYVF